MRQPIKVFASFLLMVWSFQSLNAAEMPETIPLNPGERIEIKLDLESQATLQQIMISRTQVPAVLELDPLADQIRIWARNAGKATNFVSFINDSTGIYLKGDSRADVLGTIEFWIELPSIKDRIRIEQNDPSKLIPRADPCPLKYVEGF